MEEIPFHRPLLTVAQLIGVQYTRLRTRALTVPEQVSKWYLIDLSSNERLCAGPSYPADFHRLCQPRRANQQITAQLEPVVYGDCFTIDIFPPMQINEEDVDDYLNLMGRNPVLVREDYNPHPMQGMIENLFPQKLWLLSPEESVGIAQ